MTTKDFTTTLTIDQTPQEVFDAINNVRGWWSENIEGSTDRINGEFVYTYQDVHRCKMRIVELIAEQKVVWLVLDNYFNFTKDQSEWKGTKIIFEISQHEGKTKLQFTHEGLTPQYECYNVCHDGWSNYINRSLRSLITIGKGQPNPKEGSFNEQLVEKWNLQH